MRALVHCFSEGGDSLDGGKRGDSPNCSHFCICLLAVFSPSYLPSYVPHPWVPNPRALASQPQLYWRSVEDCPIHCVTVGSIPHFYPLETSNNPHLKWWRPNLSPDIAKWPLGRGIFQVEGYCYKPPGNMAAFFFLRDFSIHVTPSESLVATWSKPASELTIPSQGFISLQSTCLSLIISRHKFVCWLSACLYRNVCSMRGLFYLNCVSILGFRSAQHLVGSQ